MNFSPTIFSFVASTAANVPSTYSRKIFLLQLAIHNIVVPHHIIIKYYPACFSSVEAFWFEVRRRVREKRKTYPSLLKFSCGLCIFGLHLLAMTTP